MSHYPINEEDQIIREEMKRQALVGEDLIKKAAVMHLLFKNGLNTKPHEFNELHKNIISNQNLDAAIERSGIDSFALKPFFMTNNKGNQTTGTKRKQAEIFKSLVGVLGIYLGFNVAFLFLIETGILDNFYVEEQQLSTLD